MILITGGMYQGKREFAKEKFNLKDCEILDFYTINSTIDIASISSDNLIELVKNNPGIKALSGCEHQIRTMVNEGKDIEEILTLWVEMVKENFIYIFNDVSLGVVPIEKKERFFREATGKVVTMIANKAEKVYRIFCGIPMTLK